MIRDVIIKKLRFSCSNYNNHYYFSCYTGKEKSEKWEINPGLFVQEKQAIIFNDFYPSYISQKKIEYLYSNFIEKYKNYE